MLEKPSLAEEKIASSLGANFGIHPVKIEFLPLGNDANSWVYRVDTSQSAYFLKLKKGPIYPPSLSVPFTLQKAGIEQVLAPLTTLNGNLSSPVDEFYLILYPFIAGQNAMETGMSPAQWVEFGTLLKRIHSAELPPQIAATLQHERFNLNPRFLNIAKELALSLPGRLFSDPIQRDLALYWSEKAAEIERILARAEEIGRMLQNTYLEFVLCHTDIHTANIIIGPHKQMHIIDWDHPLRAPKERDLMFIGGLHSSAEQISGEEIHFYNGYGKTALNPLALTYYAYEWVVQEIGDYAERVFLNPGYTEITRQDALIAFKQLFDPQDVVESAHRADRILTQKSWKF